MKARHLLYGLVLVPLVVSLFLVPPLFFILVPLYIMGGVFVLSRWIEERKRRKFFYSVFRNFYVIGLPDGPEECPYRIDRFNRLEALGEIIYVDDTEVGDHLEELTEALEKYGNDKGVTAYGYIPGYGAHRGETMEEFMYRVEQSILSRMQAHERDLEKGTGRTEATGESKEQRREWYVTYAAGNKYHTHLEPDE